MDIIVRDDQGTEYDVTVPEGASIAYAVKKAGEELGFKVTHVETPVPDKDPVTEAELKHTEHLLDMESKARARAEESVERETKKREAAEDALERARTDLDRARSRLSEAERLRAEAAGKVSGLETSLSMAQMALESMGRATEESERRSTALVDRTLSMAKMAIDDSSTARKEADQRCTLLTSEIKRPATPPKGWILDIEGVDQDRPRRRARISAEKPPQSN